MDALVYDLEIVKGILGKGDTPVEGIEYCKGWNDHKNMGISVLCAYDYVDDRMRVFCEDNLDEFLELCCGRRYLISFNGIGFDNKVIECYDKRNLLPIGSRQYDILQEIWKVTGRCKLGGLDGMCELNGIGGKTGHGALAPVHWQQGKIGNVIDYCCQDVMLTKKLFDLSQEGPIKSPKGGTLRLRSIQ